MQRKTGTRWTLSGLAIAGLVQAGLAPAATPPWGSEIPRVDAHIIVDRGTSRIRCWSEDPRRDYTWWCWNQDTVLVGYLKLDPADPKKVNLLHYDTNGRFVCRYVMKQSRSDGKSGWTGTFECPPSSGSRGASGAAAAEYNPNPLRIGPDVRLAGNLIVHIENLRLVAGPPGATLRCEWTTVYTNTGDEPVAVTQAVVDQKIPGRPGSEFNRSYTFAQNDVRIGPRQTFRKAGNMGFDSSAAGIQQIVDKGGMWWDNLRFSAVSLPTTQRPLGGMAVPVTKSFSHIACPPRR